MSTRKSFDSETARAIGARIKAIRGDRKQADFAAILGVDRATLANYENGRRIPNDVILKNISEISGRTVPELLFGNPISDFRTVFEKISEQLISASQKRPGYFPKCLISDDELALIIAFRIAASDVSADQLLGNIISTAQRIIEQDIGMTGLPVYGEGHLERLRTALQRGRLETGFDPDAALFATLSDERAARESQVQKP